MSREHADSASAENVFAAWAAQVEAGERLEFDALVAEHPDLAEELRTLHEDWKLFAPILGKVVPGLISMDSGMVVPSLTHGPDVDRDEPSEELLARLGIAAPNEGRYRFRGVLGRGGGGVVLRVWDTKLNRPLAMKVVLGRGEPRPSGETPRVDGRTLTRFVDEARIASQLNHPGIVPVHELGADESGRAFFTMKLVKGEDLARIFEKVRTGEDGWNSTRALGVLLRVCEAMAYAHDRGVIHRDLKPANVMVGPYGEVHVMDWGLARVRPIAASRPSSETPGNLGADDIRSLRRALREETPKSPIETVDGHVVGTPAYMSPEQARGELDLVGPHSDVYSVGAMIYQLIAGATPYARRGESAPARSVLAALRAGPPEALDHVAPRAEPELVAICERAMEREIDARYPTMHALGADIRAFLEGRVVAAHETGPLAEARKWARRNRMAATSAAIALLALAGGGLGIGVKAVEAAEARDDARRQAEDVFALSAQMDLDRLKAEAEQLWPPHGDKVPAYEEWLTRFRPHVEGESAAPGSTRRARPSLAEHRARLARLRASSIPLSAEQVATERESHPKWAELAAARSDPARTAEIEGLEREVNERRTFAYEDPGAVWWDRELSKLIRDIEAIDDPVRGLAGNTLAPPFGWGMAKRLEFARNLADRSIEGADARRAWNDAIEAIAASPRYGGLRLRPQLGLLPVGPDPVSGLWEFAHLMTGEAPQRDVDGKLAMEEKHGVVLVLIPGGSFWMGSQSTDSTQRNFDPGARPQESPVHEVELSPYFLSKYELTQAQWERCTALTPSYFRPPSPLAASLLHPVEQVTWADCKLHLERMGLALPSEAQWEFGARAGSQEVWWSGSERESLRGGANLADQSAKLRGQARWKDIEDWPELDDGWIVHAPIGSYAANAFGLHDVAGNVWEWVLDGYDIYPSERVKDPVVVSAALTGRIPRGGSFMNSADGARSANRTASTAEYRGGEVGVRPARSIEP